MKNKFNLQGSLLVGKNKSFDVNVEICTHELTDDLYNANDEINTTNFIDGFRLVGEMSFQDTNPPTYTNTFFM